MPDRTDTLKMPEHRLDPFQGQQPICRGSTESGYAHMNPDGTLRCNRCGWTTPGPVVTAYSTDTGRTYLTWDELVEAEATGYVVVGLTDRPGTAAVVVGPWPPTPEGKADARRAQARLRARWRREERACHSHAGEISTQVRLLWPDR